MMRNMMRRMPNAMLVMSHGLCRVVVLASVFIFAVGYAQQLEVKLVSRPLPVSPGGKAEIVIQTIADARCEIKVQYKTGPSKAKGLGSKTADSQGRIGWSWRIGFRTSSGKWPIVVTCSVAGPPKVLKTSIIVR